MIDDDPIISYLCEGPHSAKTLADKLPDQIEEHDVQEKLLDMQERGLVEPSDFAPGRWQLTKQTAQARCQP